MKRSTPAKGYSGFIVDSAASGAFVPEIGKLMVNFSAIEFLSLLWVAEMVDDPILMDVAIDMPLSRRIDLLFDLIEREKPNEKWKKHAIRGWKEVKQLSELRNAIAHGPVLFAGKEMATTGVPDLVGIAVLKYAKSKHGRQLPSIGIKGVRLAISKSGECAKNLHNLFMEYRVARAPDPEDEPATE